MLRLHIRVGVNTHIVQMSDAERALQLQIDLEAIGVSIGIVPAEQYVDLADAIKKRRENENTRDLRAAARRKRKQKKQISELKVVKS